jgi:predicted oxidoreductase
MEKITLGEKFEVSRVVHGFWRLSDWGLKKQELLSLIEQVIELGITTFDHADIYGNYTNEELFGEALTLKKELRSKIQIITKCGIKLKSDKYPERKINIYDYSYEHIISSVESSLKKLKTDYIDLLLLHRPSPFFNPQEVNRAFEKLKLSGKVLYFGVSNFTPGQYEMLSKNLNVKLVTNQVEISPICFEHFDNGNIDFFLKEKIHPMAWSPTGGGRIFNPKTNQEFNVKKTIEEVASETGNNMDAIIYAWLLKHPSHIIPIVGSRNIERIKAAVDALYIDLTLEHWFKIFLAGWGKNLP